MLLHGRANPHMDRQVVGGLFFFAMVAVTSLTAAEGSVAWSVVCNCSCSNVVVVVVVIETEVMLML